MGKTYYSDLKVRRKLLRNIVKGSEVWKKFRVFKILMYILSIGIFLSVILYVRYVSRSTEEFLEVIDVFGLLAIVCAMIPWAFYRSRLPGAFIRAGYPYGSRTGEMVDVEEDCFTYTYAETKSFSEVKGYKKGKIVPTLSVEYKILRRDILGFNIENGIVTIRGRWLYTEKYVDSIDFDAMNPVIEERHDDLHELSFLLDFSESDVKEIVSYLKESESGYGRV